MSRTMGRKTERWSVVALRVWLLLLTRLSPALLTAEPRGRSHLSRPLTESIESRMDSASSRRVLLRHR